MIDAPVDAHAPPSGPVRFARYAYPPNRLGLCGPADAPSLFGGAVAGADRELRQLAAGFEGAYPYLRLIAEENGIPDPLDAEVVEAYWLGNDLSARVRPRALHRNVVDRFRSRVEQKDWPWLEATIAGGSRPIHAFHVLEIFPRIGLLRGGRSDDLLGTIDACRIRWGRVHSVGASTLTVEVRPLELIGGKIAIGVPRMEVVSAWADATGPVDGVAAGDWVAVHWAWACERLSPAQLARLAGWTRSAVALANEAV